MGDRLADLWDRAVLERVDRLHERRGRRAAVALVLATALSGTALAFVLFPDGSAEPARPERAASARGPFLQRVPVVIERLAADRALQRKRLAASRTARSQARAAVALSRAYRRAAAALRPAGRRGAPVVRALRVTATAYATLGRASRAGARRPFASARSRVQAAEHRLRWTLRGIDVGAT